MKDTKFIAAMLATTTLLSWSCLPHAFADAPAAVPTTDRDIKTMPAVDPAIMARNEEKANRAIEVQTPPIIVRDEKKDEKEVVAETPPIIILPVDDQNTDKGKKPVVANTPPIIVPPGTGGIKPIPGQTPPIIILPGSDTDKKPAFPGHSFPADFQGNYIVKGQAVSVTSTPNELTIRTEPAIDPTGKRPVLDMSTTYSFNLASGTITVVSCMEKCTMQEFSMRDNPKAFRAALKEMINSVSRVIDSQSGGWQQNGLLNKALKIIRNTLTNILHQVSKPRPPLQPIR